MTRLGHANVQTTLNVYTQAVTADKRDAASEVAFVANVVLYELVLFGNALPR